MTVDLSKHELDLLDLALDAWEKAPSTDALVTSIITTIAMPSPRRVDNEAKMKADLSKAEEVGKHRRREATMRRAKLYQAAARESEFPAEEKS